MPPVKLALVILAVAAAVLCGPAAAGPEFPRVAIKNTTTTPPEPLRTFLDTLRDHVQAGRLSPGIADPAAKVFVLSHVSPDFSCSRDHGGVCNGQDPKGRLQDFLYRADHWEEVANLPDVPSTPTAWDAVNLTPVGLSLRPLMLPLQQQGQAYCTARLAPRSDARYQSAITALMQNPASGITDELMAIYRLNGILGTWNVRAAPDIAAPVVGKVSNELAFFPGDQEILPQVQTLPDGRSFGWYHVSLFDGTEGYVAVDDANLMTALDEGFCIALKDGRPAITEHIGGGD